MAVKLPKQLYKRGKQGTLVYSPDIAVFVKLSNDEILDLSPYLVDFTLGRVVNDASSFTCSIDNKYGQFDQVINRMDRIIVYLKRISWLQVFSGYVTTIPWQTVVPGNVTISAQCTLKRLYHNYFDQNSAEGMQFFPFFNQDTDFNTQDGGAAATIVRMLTNIVEWPAERINIQQVPGEWSADAALVIQALIKENDGDPQFMNELNQIKDSLNSIIDAFGWRGFIDGNSQDMIDQWANGTPDGEIEYTEGNWRKLARGSSGNATNAALSGNVSPSYLFTMKSNGLNVYGNSTPGDTTGEYPIYLRMDAAESLAHFVKKWMENGKKNVKYGEDIKNISVPIRGAYLDYSTQQKFIAARNGGCFGTAVTPQQMAADARFVGDIRPTYEYVRDVDTNKISDSKEGEKYIKALDKLQTWEGARLGLDRLNIEGVGVVYRVFNKGDDTFTPVLWVGNPNYTFQFINPTTNERTWVSASDTTKIVDGAFKLKCGNGGQAGYTQFGWGIAIKLSSNEEYAFNDYAKQNLVEFGWEADLTEDPNGNVWVFKSNDKYPRYWDANGRVNVANITVTPEQIAQDAQYTGVTVNVNGSNPLQMEGSGNNALFSVLWMGYNFQYGFLSDALLGERSWINDTPVMNPIKELAAASMRDFMSAPNGDFIAFVPDRIGRYTNFPAIQVRDIEVIDFKAIASDNNLVTHYLSTADVEVPLGLDEPQKLFFNSSMLTVEQAPLMNWLLGRPIDEENEDYGKAILSNFGLRPRIEENNFIRNRGFNFAYALHKFQEAWANQWQFVVNLTFMPELFPGMRIELVDRELPDGTPAPIAVYVESVTHSGSRTTGFVTTAVVSTPMVKINGKWTQYRPEFGPASMPSSGQDVVERTDTEYARKKMQTMYERNPDAFGL